MTYRAFVSARTSESIKILARRGFETALALADPAHDDLPIKRRDPSGEMVEIYRDRFLIQADSRVAQTSQGEAGFAGSILGGAISRFAPDPDDVLANPRLQEGDLFYLEGIGPATIVSLAPDRFGIEMAQWEAEGGSA